jgi:histidine triad (HIT) family protein
METIFTKIINKQIPAEIVYESESILAFKDINPQAPVHILIIPKTPTATLDETSDPVILGELLLTARNIAKEFKLNNSGYRVVINNGANAGQSVFHLHLHLLGGRDFLWPPG